MDQDLPLHILKPEKHLERAQGYFALEMFEESMRELRALPDEHPWSKDGRALLVAIHKEKSDWKCMREVARGLRLEFPYDLSWWIADAYATRRDVSVGDARKILLDGLILHYESSIIRYNLACYACVQKNFDECIDFLKEAVRRDEKYKLMALEDKDLRPVKKALMNMGWGRVVV